MKRLEKYKEHETKGSKVKLRQKSKFINQNVFLDTTHSFPDFGSLGNFPNWFAVLYSKYSALLM